MDLRALEIVDNLYRTEEVPAIDRELYDQWAQAVTMGGAVAIAGTMGAPGVTVGKLRNFQEIKEQLDNDVYLGPACPPAIGRATVWVYQLTEV
jgi:hypothetical protein